MILPVCSQKFYGCKILKWCAAFSTFHYSLVVRNMLWKTEGNKWSNIAEIQPSMFILFLPFCSPLFTHNIIIFHSYLLRLSWAYGLHQINVNDHEVYRKCSAQPTIFIKLKYLLSIYATFGDLQINDPVDVVQSANFMLIKWLQFTQTLWKKKYYFPIIPLHVLLSFP